MEQVPGDDHQPEPRSEDPPDHHRHVHFEHWGCGRREYHAGIGYRAHAGNRCAQGPRRAATSHSATDPHRGTLAHTHWRFGRFHFRRPPGEADWLTALPGSHFRGHFRPRRHSLAGLLFGARNLKLHPDIRGRHRRHDPGHSRRSPRPGPGDPERVTSQSHPTRSKLMKPCGMSTEAKRTRTLSPTSMPCPPRTTMPSAGKVRRRAYVPLDDDPVMMPSKTSPTRRLS